MMTYRNGTVPTHVWPRLYSLLARGRATLHTWQHRREERRALRDLLRLDDWLLADIGCDRNAVAWEVRRPFWQPLARWAPGARLRPHTEAPPQTGGPGDDDCC